MLRRINQIHSTSQSSRPTEEFWADRPAPFLYVLLFGVFFSVNCEAFFLTLSFNNFVRTGSILLNSLGILNDIFCVALVLADVKAKILFKICTPIWALLILGALSTLWSIDHIHTVKSVRNFASPCFMTFAMAGRFGVHKALRMIIAYMTLLCFLSIVWVIAIPSVGVHQASDPIQAVHAGLWRGVFEHKQRLGMFGGLTAAVALFYGSNASWKISGAVLGTICLVGSESATGLVVALTVTGLSLVCQKILRAEPTARSRSISFVQYALVAATALYMVGALNLLPTLFGKSADMTGRASLWPYLLGLVRGSGRVLWGAGDGNGVSFAETLLGVTIGVDNGYVDRILTLGYVGLAAMLAIHLRIWNDGAKLIVSARRHDGNLGFPFVFLTTFLIENITEGLFMKKDIDAILLCIAVIIVKTSAAPIQPNSAASSPGKRYRLSSASNALANRR